ncbi:ADP-ribosylglycohydrolase family protein [Sulfurimonas sp.]|nr:ADP-ribosylglycohydrolase family protein [Sulfurimonas sp.]
MNDKITNSILASLTADAYALGAHWVYDEEQLSNLPINWETLNDAQSMWHDGKKSGDFTHYGDQTLFLLEYMSEKKEFNKDDFYEFWSQKMKNYGGYIDGATRNALENMGTESADLSICGHIAPLLLHVKSQDEFLKRVKDFTSITHNSPLAQTASQFFAELFYASLEGKDIQKTIEGLKPKYPSLSTWIDEGMSSKDKDTSESIRGFGPACGIDGGFSGVIHLLCLGDDFKEVMIKNSKAGGDSSARGMVVAMILGTRDEFKMVYEWLNNINTIEKINTYIQRLK